MLTEVKNQLKVTVLSIKYGLMREMLNKVTFVSNVVFMILNNATFIIQWIVLYSLKDNVGGYTFKQILLLWGLAASTFGVAHFLFKRAFGLSNIINTGKLDSYLVQPKNVLLSAITSDVEPSALGDFIYGLIMLFIYGFTFKNFVLFTVFSITGGLIMASVAVILASLSFWISKSDAIAEKGNSMLTSFGTYPDGIFKGFVKLILFTLIPIGFINYIPVRLLTNFNLGYFFLVIAVTIIIVMLAFLIFYRGLKRYSSSNLMIARV